MDKTKPLDLSKAAEAIKRAADTFTGLDDAECAILAEAAAPHILGVVMTPCVDMETRAAIWNEGYEEAMSQHLADDPTLAEDWLNAKLAEAWRRGREAAADAPNPYGEWEAPRG